MTEMGFSEVKFLETLQDVPPSWKSGYTPVKEKRGFVVGWQNKPLTIHQAIKLGTNYIHPTKKTITTLDGLGLHLNEYTKTGCLDFDKDKLTKEEIEDKFREHFGRGINELPKSISWKSGKLNRYQIAFEIPENYWETITHVKQNPKLPEIELRWGKCQSVLPPSSHPDTGSYKWIHSPSSTQLAIAPPWFLDGWVRLSEKKRWKKRKAEDFHCPRAKWELDTDSERVEEGLNKYCQDHKYYTFSNYDQWNEIGMALHSLSKEWEEKTQGKIVDRHLDDWLAWSNRQPNYDYSACMKKWENDYKEDGGIKIGTFFDYCESNPIHPKHKNWLRRHQKWEELAELEPPKEPPKRQRDVLLNDIFESAKRGDNNSYFEDFAEMEIRFRRKPSDIATDLLKLLRDKFTNKVYSVGEVDMSKVESLEYLLEGYVLKGEVGLLYAPFSTGKTSLACGMVKSAYNKVGFLDQVRKRDGFESLMIMSDGGANRFKEVYDQLKLSPEMVKVWASDNKQAIANWKCDLRGLIKLHNYLKENPQIKLVIIDSVISMLSGTHFSYCNNNEVDLIVDFLRSIICEPLGVSVMLLSHLSTDKGASSGAKRWVGACGWVAEIKPVTVNEQEDYTQRKLLIRKDPINGKRVFDFKIDENGIFVPVYNSDMKGDCFGELKQHIQQINFATGRKVFDAKDFHQINYSSAQVNRALAEHWKAKYGILKRKVDSSGKVVRGKYVLKTQYILINDDKNEQKPIGESDFWKN